MASSHSDIVDYTNNVDFPADNVIIMEIDNILAGWPTYEIKFTPQKPGPVKLVIRLKDAVKLVPVEESTDSEAELLFPSRGQKRTSSSSRKTKKFKTDSNADVNKLTEILAGVRLTSTGSGSTLFHASPVRLVGICNPPPPAPATLKRKFTNDKSWPPARSRTRTLRDIENNEKITSFQTVKTLPAAVAADKTNM
ncbi:hypothetical protein P692DRAFT_20756962 [Suillus brevipes Sb2]|nr:hypothetical protein P692DRAFT_20756962 [Suillus brevipes Sb2]